MTSESKYRIVWGIVRNKQICRPRRIYDHKKQQPLAFLKENMKGRKRNKPKEEDESVWNQRMKRVTSTTEVYSIEIHLVRCWSKCLLGSQTIYAASSVFKGDSDDLPGPLGEFRFVDFRKSCLQTFYLNLFLKIFVSGLLFLILPLNYVFLERKK